MKQEYSAGGVVCRKTQKGIEILFILDPYDKWAFPKGHIEGGEKPEQAALREIEEETGIGASNLEIMEDLDTMEYQFTLAEQKIHKLVHFYLVKSKSDVKILPQRQEGIKDVKWVDLDKALDFLEYDNSREVLRKAIGYIKRK